jgi:hypothetical protein
MGATTPVPLDPGPFAAVTRAAADGEDVIAATTAAAVELGVPELSVPSVTVMSPRATATASGEFATPGLA